MLDINYVRSQFPGLNTDWVLFDNAGGSQILKPVVDRVNEYFYSSNVQLGASYPHSVLAEERHLTAHKKLDDNFRRTLKEGDEIIVTNCDHEANIGAWRDLANYGITVKEWRLNPDTFRLQAEDLQELLSDKTKLVAFTAASNVLGQINPIKEFTALAHRAGALVCVDAVAYAPHCLMDVQETDVDFFVFSFYKTYGPHYAMMYGKLADHHGYVGENEVRSKMKFSYALIEEHEEFLSKKVLDYLNARNDIRIIGPREYSKDIRVPTIAFVKENSDSQAITQKTDEHKVAIRWGNFYARRLIDDHGFAGQNGVVRISMVHYNTLEETDSLLKALDYALI